MKVNNKYIEQLTNELSKLIKKSVKFDIETWSHFYDKDQSVDTKTKFQIAIVDKVCEHHDFIHVSSAIDFLLNQIKKNKKEKAA